MTVYDRFSMITHQPQTFSLPHKKQSRYRYKKQKKKKKEKKARQFDYTL